MKSGSSCIITAEDFFRLPGLPGRRSELLGGIVRYRPFVDAWNGAVAATLAYHLHKYVADAGCGRCLAGGTGFIVHRNPDTVRVPAGAFVSHERWKTSGEKPGEYLPFAPDLVFEVRSSFDADDYYDEKVKDWFASDVRLVWIVHPWKNSVAIFRSRQNIQVLSEADSLIGDDVLPGFLCSLKDAFHTEERDESD